MRLKKKFNNYLAILFFFVVAVGATAAADR